MSCVTFWVRFVVLPVPRRNGSTDIRAGSVAFCQRRLSTGNVTWPRRPHLQAQRKHPTAQRSALRLRGTNKGGRLYGRWQIKAQHPKPKLSSAAKYESAAGRLSQEGGRKKRGNEQMWSLMRKQCRMRMTGPSCAGNRISIKKSSTRILQKERQCEIDDREVRNRPFQRRVQKDFRT